MNQYLTGKWWLYSLMTFDLYLSKKKFFNWKHKKDNCVHSKVGCNMSCGYGAPGQKTEEINKEKKFTFELLLVEERMPWFCNYIICVTQRQKSLFWALAEGRELRMRGGRWFKGGRWCKNTPGRWIFEELRKEDDWEWGDEYYLNWGEGDY